MGTIYRDLDENELIKDGDEYFNTRHQEWRPQKGHTGNTVRFILGCSGTGSKMRRPVKEYSSFGPTGPVKVEGKCECEIKKLISFGHDKGCPEKRK